MIVLSLVATGGALARTTVAATTRPALRVCADPNNLPFSNRKREGFENKIAEQLARSMGAEVEYTWWAQRRGFVRNTLGAGLCDVIMGVPSAFEPVARTRPYYRSSYVFVTLPGRAAISSFDDPALRRLRVGIPLIGDDGANPPPEQALAARGIIDNVVGYGVYGDYTQPDPPLEPLRALARGELDVAVVWGPVAGFFARGRPARLTVRPVVPDHDGTLPFAFDITVGVRSEPRARPLRDRLDRALRDEREAIERILDEYGVPRS